MKVLITGGAGFIGSHIVDKLIQDNFEVVVVDNLSSGCLENLPNPNIKFYQKDILTDELNEIFDFERPDYCIHLAAQTSVVKSIQNPVFDSQLNVVASIKLIELCKQYKIKKFIVSSTAAVYGTPKYLPVDENHPTEPISYYGLSKLAMEKFVQLSGVPYVIFRFANVYGPRQASSQESGVVAIFNNKMLKNEPINIFGNGEQIRDFVYVEDIAQACVLALENESLINQVLNYSTNKGITVNELFDIMKEEYNYSLSVNYLPERDGDIKDSILSNKKTIDLLEIAENTTIHSGIKKLKDYYTKREEVNA